MALQFSLAHLTVLTCSPMDMIHIAHRTGYNFVSLRLTAVTPKEHVFALQNDRAMMTEVKALLKDTGVRVLDIELARMPPEVEPETYAAILDAAAELGAQHILAQLPDPDRARATARFARLCDMALPLGLSIGLESPTWTATPDLRSAADVVRAVGRSNAGIVVDTLHFNRSRDSIDELRTMPREWFRFAQVCDASAGIPDTTEGLIHTARSERLVPGEGGIDIRGILDALPAIPYSLEIPNDPQVQTLGHEEWARRCIEGARRYLA
ncbi:TIM barrel protein [Castellaniella sp. MT123]|uniref:sugar phosphate isomerase/epimerase family protein n=1 Tax=Castellaniella sp. MT123 TaxID=3140381 RepID=UPI0031F430AE